ncbi:MAG: hypothetical protein ACI8ZN_002195 [Bacteroidia bacterium]|jgi:hypothetical protein
MKTIKIDIINEKVLTLLKELEQLKLIRFRTDNSKSVKKRDLLSYKGSLKKETLSEVDAQLKELRDGWE